VSRSNRNCGGVPKQMRQYKKSITTDRKLIGIVNENPGLSINRLRHVTGWTRGHVDGSIRRLLKSKKIYIKALDECGRIHHFVYPFMNEPPTRIEIPSNLISAGNPTWQEAHIYGLDNTTIGVAGEKIVGWEEKAWKKSVIPTRNDKSKISFDLPEEFCIFYQLDRKSKTVAVGDRNILITISGEIITQKEYPT